jgi:hypothetical protein
MGTTLSDLATEAKSLDYEKLKSLWREDQQVLHFEDELFDPRVLTSLDLQPYSLPALSSECQLQEGDVLSKELEVGLSDDSKRAEKSSELVSHLINENLKLALGKNEVDNNSLRLKTLLRIYHAVLREQARQAKIDEEEHNSGASESLPASARLAIKFGIGSLMHMIRRVGKLDAELYKDILQEVSEILLEFKPQALSQADPTINSAFGKVSGFFEAIVSGGIREIRPKDQLLALNPLLGLSLVTGNIAGVASIALKFMNLEPSAEILEVYKAIHPMLLSLYELASNSEMVTLAYWDRNNKSSDIDLDPDCIKAVKKGTQNSWATTQQVYTSRKHYIELTFENVQTEVYVAVVNSEDKLSDSYTKDESFAALAGDGRVLRGANEIAKGNVIASGDKIGVLLNLDEKSCSFYINNQKLHSSPVTEMPASVKLAVLISKPDVAVRINSSFCPSDEVRHLLYSKDPEGTILNSPALSVLKSAYSEEALRQLKPLHVSSFLLECLSQIGEGNLEMLENFGRSHKVTHKMGLKLGLSQSTLEYLKSILMKVLDLIYSKNFTDLPENLLYQVAKSILRLIRSHLLGSLNLKKSGISSALRQDLNRVLFDFLTSTSNSLVQKELTITLSSCFEAFYESSQEKLDYLISRLIMIKNNQDQTGIGLELQHKMFKKMRNPAVIISILTGNVDKSRVKNFLELLISVANEKCIQLIQGTQVRSDELVKLLISIQKVVYFLATESSTSEAFKDLVMLYSVKICNACDAQAVELRRVVRVEKITPEILTMIKKTMLYSLFPSLMYIVSISQITLDVISQLVPKVIKILAALKKYHAPEPELVLGKSSVTSIYESDHPYSPSIDSTYKVAVPRAQKYTLTFDSQCMTESSCDYMELYLDLDKTKHFCRWDGSGFPKEPIVVNSPVLLFTFHSDTSVQYWGWKIEILAEIDEKYVKQEWPEHVNEACSYAISNMCRKLIAHDFDMGAIDETILKALKTPLISYGVQDKAIARLKSLEQMHPGLIELAQSPELSSKLTSQLTKKLGQESAKRLLPRVSSPHSLLDYVEKFTHPTASSLNPFIMSLIEGKEAILGGWRELKKKAGVTGAMTTIGGNDLNIVERAIFAVYISMFDIVDTVSKLFENPSDLGPTLIYIIKHACKIRTWAQQRKQKLMDQGKKDMNYSILAKEIVDKCIILLHSDFRHALHELGIDKILSHLLPTVAKAQTKELLVSKLTGKWKPMQDALDVNNKLRNLILLRESTSKAEEDDDIKQFMKVANAVEEVLNDMSELIDIAKAIEVKRIWAVSRCLGFNLLAYMMSISNGYITEPAIALSRALRKKEVKLHYADGLEGADPYLLNCVQDSFFNLYEVLQREVRKIHDDKTTVFSLKHAVVILESLSLYIKHIDMHKLIESHLAETFKILLEWSKGHIGAEADSKTFAKEDCVTSIIIKRENDLITGSLRVKVWDVAEGEHVYIEYFKGGDLRPIVEVKVSTDESVPGLEDLSGPIEMGGITKRIFARRAYPAASNSYLSSIVSLDDFKFKTHDELYKEKDEELKKSYTELKERVSKSAWNLCKILLYSSARSKTSANESNLLQVHELYLNTFDREFLLPELQDLQPDTKAIKNMISGSSWLAKNSIPVGVYPNPMAVWLKNFRAATAGMEDFVLAEAINAWVRYVDPGMKGILSAEDISILDPTGKALVDEYKGTTLNTDHQHDFFRLLHVLKRKAGDLGEESSNFLYQNDLFESIPDDFQAAKARIDSSNVRNIIRDIKQKMESNSASPATFNQFIKVFEENMQTPGLVPIESIRIPVPDQFLNSEKQLDFYKAIQAIKADSETFHIYYDEIKNVLKSYSDLPKSVSDLTKFSSDYGDYLGSLLWVLYYTSPYLTKELSRVYRLEYLMRLALLCNSDRINTPAFRILSKILSTQHSPLTLVKVWDSIKLSLPKSLSQKSSNNFIAYLLTLIGLRNSWQVQDSDLLQLDRQASEAENCLRTLFFSDRWRKNIIEQSVKIVTELVEGFSNGRLPDELELGVITFLGMNSPYAVCMERLPCIWSRAKVKQSNIDEGVIVGIEGENVQILNPDADAEASEPMSKVEAILPSKKGDIYSFMDDTEVTQMLDQVANLWKVSQTSKPKPTGPIKQVVGMQNILKHFEVYLIEAMNALASKKQGNGRSISKKSIDAQLKLLRDYKEASLALSAKLKSGPTISLPPAQITEEEAGQKLLSYSEDDQILAMELASSGIPTPTIIIAFEKGIKSRDQIIAIHSNSDKQNKELFKLEYFNDQSFELVDISDTASFFQSPKGHIVINSAKGVDEKKLITRAFPSDLFNKVSWLFEQITVLFTISGSSKTHRSMYGFKIGELEVNLENIVDAVKVSVNDILVTNGSAKSSYSFKLVARATGDYILSCEAIGLRYENSDFSIFNGFSIGNFGIFLKQGNRAVLKGLAVYEGNSEENAEYWREDDSYEKPPRGRTIRATSKIMKLLQNRLALTGAPGGITQHIANQFYDLEQGINALLDSEDSRNWPVLLEKEFYKPIIDVKLFEPNEAVSDGYLEIPAFRDGESVSFKMPGRKTIAIKRHTQKGNPAEFVSSISADSPLPTDLGNLDLSPDSDVPLNIYIDKLQGSQIAARKPLRNLILIYSTDPYNIQVPAGYNMVDNKEHLAINLAPNTDPIYYAFLCYTTKSSILGCPVNELSQTHIKDTQYGIVDYFEGEGNTIEQSTGQKTDWSIMSPLELLHNIHQIEEQRVQEAGKNFMLTAVKRKPDSFISTAESKGIGYLLNTLKDNLSDIESTIDQIVTSGYSEFRYKLMKELVYQFILSSTLVSSATASSLIYESKHEYDNNLQIDEVIHIPGAQRLRVEFDPKCETESGCDYVRFYRSPNRQDLIKEFAGSGSTWQNFEVEGDTVYMYFYTDGSRTFWGYRFTVIGMGLRGKSDPLSKKSNPESAIWLLERMTRNGVPKGLERLAGKEVIVPLFTFLHAVDDVNLKLRALNILKNLLIASANPYLDYIYEIFLEQANILYNQYITTKMPNPLLQALIVFISEVLPYSNVKVSHEWFIEVMNTVSDLRGVAYKNSNLDIFLFELFKDINPIQSDVTIESAHPYNKTTKTAKLNFPEASAIAIEFDGQSALDPGDDILFTADRPAKKLLQSDAGERLVDATWLSTPSGPDISITNEGKTVTRTNDPSWGSVFLGTSFNKDVWNLSLVLETLGSSLHLYIGIVSGTPTSQTWDMTRCINEDFPTDLWTIRRNGEFKQRGQGSAANGDNLCDGDILDIRCDMIQKTVTFYRNGALMHVFNNIGDEVTPCICFGGLSQVITIRALENLANQDSSQGSRKLKFTTDTVYYHFPINAGYKSKYSWDSVKGLDLALSDDDCKLTRLSSSSGVLIHSASPSFSSGKHYISLQISKLPAKSAMLIGFIPDSLERSQSMIGNNTLVYRNIGNAFFSGQSVACKTFVEGDELGAYIDFSSKEVRFYKNSVQTASSHFELPVQDYKFAVMFTAEGQEVKLLNERIVPEDIDLLNVPRSSEMVSASWGLKIKVRPIYVGRNIKHMESLLSRANPEILKKWNEYRPKYVKYFQDGTAEELVRYLDELGAKSEKKTMQMNPEDLNPNPKDLVYYRSLEKLKLEDMRELFRIVKKFNQNVEDELPLFDLHVENEQYLTEIQRIVMASRNILFLDNKKTLLQGMLDKTKTDNSSEITIDRPKALRNKERGVVDTEGQISVFGQIYRAINSKPNNAFRHPEKIFRVNYRGEGSIDAGGPYNEVMSNMCDELQSSFLRLLVPTQNHTHDLGDNRDAFILNPQLNTKTEMDMVFFLGKMFGVALRTQNNLNLALSPLFWKRLVLDHVTLTDLKSADESCFQLISILNNLEGNGITPDSFASGFDEMYFTTQDSSGHVVELVEGGQDIRVTFDNAKDYASLIEKFRLSEAALPYSILRKGMSATIPMDLLNLFSWRQVETLICGASDIDIDLLKANTEYKEGVSENDRHVQYLWEVLREFSPKERTLFLKFTWGRSRLPASREFRKMQISRYNSSGPVDNYLPVSHTCFFTIDLPAYSSKEVMHDKLLYAITHCQAIDLDGAAGAGWEDD